jgi:hypothetical protein
MSNGNYKEVDRIMEEVPVIKKEKRDMDDKAIAIICLTAIAICSLFVGDNGFTLAASCATGIAGMAVGRYFPDRKTS